MNIVQKGTRVQVHYTGSFTDGTVFDTSRGRSPLAFTVGRGEVIPGFDRAVLGLATGGTASVTIEPSDGYGEYRNEFVIRARPEDIPQDITPEVGMELTLHHADGGEIPVRVTEVTDTRVTLDANHPLAGKTLQFDIEIIAVE